MGKKNWVETLKLMVMVLIAFNIILVPNQNALADTGPKPTLDIFVENADNESYYLDLLGKRGEYQHFDSTDGNKEYDNMHEEPIYKYNKDGWEAIHMRTWLLHGKLTGDPVEKDSRGKVIKMKHSFGYHGVPKEFKIIVQRSDGSLQVSEVIKNKHFNTVVRYDMKSNKVLSIKNSNASPLNDKDTSLYNLLSYFERLFITLIVEIAIAFLFFKINRSRLKVLGITNFITQTLLTLGIIAVYPLTYRLSQNFRYFIVLTIGEVLVLLAEYRIYSKRLDEPDNKRVLIYTLLANLASVILGFLVLK